MSNYERRLAETDPRDWDAIAADWRAVGDDMRTAMGLTRQFTQSTRPRAVATPAPQPYRAAFIVWSILAALFTVLVLALAFLAVPVLLI